VRLADLPGVLFSPEERPTLAQIEQRWPTGEGGDRREVVVLDHLHQVTSAGTRPTTGRGQRGRVKLKSIARAVVRP
jgi:hypothetical protein